MTKIDTTGWKEFLVGELFEKLDLKFLPERDFNKGLDISESKSGEFNLPLVNAKHSNNGIMYYGRKSEWESASMTIDIVADGAASTGDVYAQPQETGVLYNAYLVKPKVSCVTEAILFFLATVVQRCVKDHFGYDNKCTWEKVKLETVMLPVDASDEPDWAYMDKYMSEVIRESEASLENLRHADGGKHAVDVSGWKEFVIGDLFDIHPTKAYKMINAQLIDDGENPVVVNSSYNNGIGGYSTQSVTEKGGIVTFSDTTTAGAIFYQPYDFVGYPHVQGMYPTGKYAAKWGENQLLFFVAAFKKAAVLCGFDYAYKFTREIASAMKVLLPVDMSGEPDWAYMDECMWTIMDNTESDLSAMRSIG